MSRPRGRGFQDRNPILLKFRRIWVPVAPLITYEIRFEIDFVALNRNCMRWTTHELPSPFQISKVTPTGRHSTFDGNNVHEKEKPSATIRLVSDSEAARVGATARGAQFWDDAKAGV
ncbi:hypothetical protein AVEN_188517-1 [Araneus ventricosus]|uniref:Uncharacterized protein n=1 Tax=Araneus ventricosus TaxID=182803 RepID=A0A4Y2VUZ4_ARAVE|nr:hypothetical protein AVEN_196963-1 [Araneus ventricosus]GBO28493.1 hypothetical protein AVEN_188517-1 [Araneus ventricosus]